MEVKLDKNTVPANRGFHRVENLRSTDFWGYFIQNKTI